MVLGTAACSDDPVGQQPPDSGPSADAGSAADAAVDPDAMPVVNFEECDAGDQAFVHSAYLAVLGRRPGSQAEVEVYTEIIAKVRALVDAGDTAADPRRVAVEAMMQDPGYVERWAAGLMEALRVQRIEVQSAESCYGRKRRDLDDGSLAQYVRDNPPTAGDDGNGAFGMYDVVRSALVLDDVSPVYRAHLFVLVSRAIQAGNVPLVEAELARREDFGQLFDATYLNRDIVCLGCHNSAGSVTDHPDPELDRHWSLPGLFERALYGEDIGVEVERAHAPFRYDGLVANLGQGDTGNDHPWGWYAGCGGFYLGGLTPDPAAIDGKFGNLTGSSLTIYDLEDMLDRGFDALASGGLVVEETGEIADPDAAFAYLVSAAIVEAIWEEVIGTPLTIANYFPRNEPARDLLAELTDDFVANQFSLRELLIAIVSTPYFNRLAPEAGCGQEPYNMPPVYDPWTTADADETRRANSPGDGVVALSARTLLGAAYQALEWPEPRFARFPHLPSEYSFCESNTCSQMNAYCAGQGVCCVTFDLLCANPPGPNEPTSGEEREFLRAIGTFLKNGDPGFRGLDFQARLVWEDRFAGCRKMHTGSDFIDEVVSLATQRGGTVADVIVAVKDRLVGEPFIRTESLGAEVSEAQALEVLFGVPLDTPASALPSLHNRTRAFCGAMIASPQFMLSGLAPSGGEVPVLTPDSRSFDSICGSLESHGLTGGLQLSCDGGSLGVVPTAAASDM